MVDIAPHQLSGDMQTSSKVSFSLFGMSFSVLDIFLLGLMACILGLQLNLQLTQKINWDEFFYLSHIYDGQRGSLDKVLQMAHTHLLGWITAIPGNEIAQIKFGRLIMWCVQLMTLGLIVKTARRFMSLTSALFAALCFISIGFVFIHGTSFRADPLAACLMTYAIYVFAASDLRYRDLLGLAIALALGALITMKVILFAPLLAVLTMWRLNQGHEVRPLFIKFIATASGAAVIFMLGYGLQASQISSGTEGAAVSKLSGTLKTSILSGGLFPRAQILKVGFVTALLPILLIAVGILTAILTAIRTPSRRSQSLILAAFALPLLSFIFYRNAYPYFYAFIFPSAVILAGYAVERLKLSKVFIASLAGFMALNIALIYSGRKDETLSVQVQTLEVVHKMFPEPIAYFDRSGMIASFPKAGLFMSGWGLRSYTLKGDTRFLNEMKDKTVPLLIDNSPVISAAMAGKASALLDKDTAALKDNYIHHWGHIWVAGKTLNVISEPLEITVLVPGLYTLQSEISVNINGEPHAPEETVFLERGRHIVQSATSQIVTLRWGEDLYRPTTRSLSTPIFSTF